MMEEQFLNTFMEKEYHNYEGWFDGPGNPIEGKLIALFVLFSESVR